MLEYKSLNAVIGYPLAHSQSHLLHNTVYQALNIHAVLLPLSNPALGPLIQDIKKRSIELTAVTMPFKQEILSYLDGCGPEVQTLKAANTIIQREGQLYGYNTDIDGIAYALRDTIVAGKNVLILGAGGAARAIGYFMQRNNARLFWLNRRQENGLKMVKNFGGKIITPEQAYRETVDIIVNATPVGMSPYVDGSPLPDYPFYSDQIVFDLVYSPLNTVLLREAQKFSAKIISGMDMFIGQGLKQIELWTGRKIPGNFFTSIPHFLRDSANYNQTPPNGGGEKK